MHVVSFLASGAGKTERQMEAYNRLNVVFGHKKSDGNGK